MNKQSKLKSLLKDRLITEVIMENTGIRKGMVLLVLDGRDALCVEAGCLGVNKVKTNPTIHSIGKHMELMGELNPWGITK